MPRKSSSESPAPRRVSARIAAAVVAKPQTSPSPAKKTTPKRTKKEPVPTDTDGENEVPLNGTDQVSSDASITEKAAKSSAKKPKKDDKNQPSEVVPETKHSEGVIEAMTVDAQAEDHKPEQVPAHVEITPQPEATPVAATELGFEVIDKSSVPSSDSEEVKAAVNAQGEDGGLLVNFVQISKDEVPAPEAVAEIIPEKVLSENCCDINGITASVIPHGDAESVEISTSPKNLDDTVHDKVEAIVPPPPQDMPAEL